MTATRYLPAARMVAHAIPHILGRRGLQPLINRNVLTETDQGNVWLFVVFDVSPEENPQDYATPEVLLYLSNALNGLPVVISSSYGMHYSVLLNNSYAQFPA